MFDVTILSPKAVLFEGKAKSVFLPGDQGEFEILSYHSPVISLLKPGRILIDSTQSLSVKKGLLRFYHNQLVVLVE